MAMIKQPTKKIEFGEKDESFVKQLAKDIGCHYLQTNPRTYCLNKFKSDVQCEKGVFAWVHKEEKDYFWVSTRKVWIEAARSNARTIRKPAAPSCLPRNNRHADDSVIFDTRSNYEQAVSSLKMVSKML
jgi:hypothetical protein